MDAYATLVQLVMHAESITWNRFYNFLMANSILVLAWAVIFASDAHSLMVTHVLIALCLLGGLSGPVFAALGIRGRKFLDEYIRLGSVIEDTAIWPNALDKCKPLTKTKDLIKTLPYGWSGSRYILKVGPWFFTILYIILVVASLKR